MGVGHHELRVLDRHRARGHADLGDPASGRRRLAPAGDTLAVYFDAMDGSVEHDFVLFVENARTGESIFGAGTSSVDGNAGTFVVPGTDDYRVRIDDLRAGMTGDVDPNAVGHYRFAITPRE